ncbi:conserved hypothetical protein [Paraburkholderia ribeironis]|uniref:Uncharacterized protein n=1 Tax=Paraburkholderia ribeironis TaxID=1247936 RepID=A0A1N7S1I6_9BURK|nr:hypothetical protein [Paraburkholderia ribeironis]SIT41206.1 conserved hypothetical protein [Paraburkholderia ribeironis]
MKKLICVPAAAARFDHQGAAGDQRAAGDRRAAGSSGFSYRRHVAAPRALFAAPSADLLTLVVAEALKRNAQAGTQRDALRDAVYEMPLALQRNHERSTQIARPDSGA